MSHSQRRYTQPWPQLPADATGPAGWLFLDIETMGLKPTRDQVTLVGILYGGRQERVLHQYFVEDPADEAEVLRSVARVVRSATRVVTYNGQRFDVPYLAVRAALYDVVWPACPQVDLLQLVRNGSGPRRFFSNFRLQTVIRELGLPRQDETSGAIMVDAYARWVEDGDKDARALILDHNADDLVWMPELAAVLLARSDEKTERG